MIKSSALRIKYHQMVTRPSLSPVQLQTKFTSSVPRPPLRIYLGIRHPAVKDFSADTLWEQVTETLTESHDGTLQPSCNFVLVVCGDLVRETTSKGHSSAL
jgi:hypothetical protein